MNTSILIKSFGYIETNFKVLVSLSIWIYQEFTEIEYKKIKLEYALYRSDLDVVRLFIDRYKNILKLSICVYHTYPDNRDLTKLIISHIKGADEDYLVCFIENACINNDIDILEFIMQNGIDVSDSIMYFFAGFGYLDSIKLFESKGCKLTPKMVISAARNKHFHIVEYLMEKGLNINESLIFACEFGNIDMVEKLLQSGLVLGERLSENSSAIKQLDIMKLLLENGTQRHLFPYGRLMKLCIKQNRLDIISILFDPESESNFDNAHLSIVKNKIEITKFFIDNCAYNKRYAKALSKIARIKKNEEAAKLLQKIRILD